jgi:hypothetical protein
MNRRAVLQNLATAAGGLLVLPAWANGWNKASVMSFETGFSLGQDALLAEMVETIIPATDTPGAKALHVHTFIQKMITDCYEQDVQQNTLKGLLTVEELSKQQFGQPFVACPASQRMDILGRLEKSEDTQQKSFYSLIKELTIQGYLSSEYVMVNHSNYQMAPGHYYGCVPVTTK